MLAEKRKQQDYLDLIDQLVETLEEAAEYAGVDEETVEQIRENPYLQYFLGFKEYKDEEPFHPTMFVHFRKRIDKKTLSKVNDIIAKKALAEAMKA